MKLLVGLGNPGSRYAATRHNIGFMVLDEVARRFPVQPVLSDAVVDVCQATIDQCQVLLLKPQTYMNLSGVAVQRVLTQTEISPAQMLVIHDDLDLSVGQIRIRQRGGHGGHKGIRSIIEHLHTPEFIRIRMGIGRPARVESEAGLPMRSDVVDYVLQPFDAAEQPVVHAAIRRVQDAIGLIVHDHVEAAMNQYNRREGRDGSLETHK